MSGAEAWIDSGAASLTGPADGPGIVPPAGVLDRIGGLGTRAGVDAFATLAERAAIAGLRRQGQVSCGGASRLLPAADGWIAVTLARPGDHGSVPAWLEIDGTGWDDVAAAVGRRPVATLVERAVLLGLAVAAVPAEPPAVADPVTVRRLGDRSAAPRSTPLVVDLSSLWAGPLTARVLGDRGAAVVKVESAARPDGARRGPAAFYDRLHAGHRSAALDLGDDVGIATLRRLLHAADVVIEASRPRALDQLGVRPVPDDPTGPAVWVAITAHGRAGESARRVGFGDDAAAGGGLVAPTGAGPVFVADAIADPLTGLAAAAATLDLLDRPGRWFVDASLATTAAWVASGGGTGAWTTSDDPPPPPAVPPAPPAAALGADTVDVLAELGIR